MLFFLVFSGYRAAIAPVQSSILFNCSQVKGHSGSGLPRLVRRQRRQDQSRLSGRPAVGVAGRTLDLGWHASLPKHIQGCLPTPADQDSEITHPVATWNFALHLFQLLTDRTRRTETLSICERLQWRTTTSMLPTLTNQDLERLTTLYSISAISLLL